MVVMDMTKAKRYDTIVLTQPVASFRQGQKGAVVEVYTTPCEAYDIEIVDEGGTTKGLLEAVRPEQLQVTAASPATIRFTAIRIDGDGSRASVEFSDGSHITTYAEELYSLKQKAA
ncbi:MAG: hypothetical protein AUJ92_22090 [Armatimonadetes bacterium CG2_30_59_28]|nr:MAG: hypothetical protein AUJ92_22090 [Armatimonadetes bacterium CG2_30_59_28]